MRSDVQGNNGYDAVGNKTSVQDGNLKTTKFCYDGLNRNTKVTDPAGTLGLNELMSYTDGTRSVSLSYDLNGNRQARAVTGGSDNGTETYAYDFENRLVSLTTSSGSPIKDNLP